MRLSIAVLHQKPAVFGDRCENLEKQNKLTINKRNPEMKNTFTESIHFTYYSKYNRNYLLIPEIMLRRVNSV